MSKLANSKKKTRLLQKKMYDITCNFLFGDVVLTEEFKDEFYDYIDRNIDKIHCCVLWDRSRELVSMLERHNMPSIGKKEVCLEGLSVRASTNYRTAPFRQLNPDLFRNF